MVRLVVSSIAESAIMIKRHGVSNGKSKWALVPSDSGVMSVFSLSCWSSLIVMEP